MACVSILIHKQRVLYTIHIVIQREKKTAVRPPSHDQEAAVIAVVQSGSGPAQDCAACSPPLPPLPLSVLGLLFCLILGLFTSLQYAPKLKEADTIPDLFFLLHLELRSNPGISANASANTSTLVEGIDSVVAKCLTNSSNIKWYVNSVPTSGSNRMTISPDGKTLVIHRVSRSDHNLQCAIEDIPDILQRSEMIRLTVACECMR